MTPARWDQTRQYLQTVFGREDQQLSTIMPRAIEAGIPDIAVSSEVGRLLLLLTRLAGGGCGASRALELGTLAGYSAIWIARGLAPSGRLITVEPEPKHAAFARTMFKEAGVAERIELRQNKAIPVLNSLAAELGNESFDLMFFDAIKTEYPEYLRLAKPLLKPGALLIADNVLGGGDWWIDTPPGENASRDAVDTFNRTLAADPDFAVAAVPIREGILIAHRRPE